MKITKRVLALLLAAMMTVGMLAGCASQESEAQAPEETAVQPNLAGVDNDLTMEAEGEVDTSKVLTTLIDCDATPAFNGNPYDETAGINWSIQPFMYDYLAFFSPMPERTFKNSLMESYTYEDLVMTIKLLPDLKWSDGSALNADDVLTNFYCDLTATTLWNYMEKIEKVDDLTIRMTFCQDSPLLLNLVVRNPIRTPDEIYGKWAEQYKDVAENMRVYDEESKTMKFTDEGNEKNAAIKQDLLSFKPAPDEVVCSGPYVIDKYNTSEILFKANPEYRQEMLIPTIRGLRPGDSQAFATALLGNEYTIENGGLNLDMSAQIDAKYADTMRKIFVPELSQIGYTMNVQAYPLDKPEVRKAISMAIDRNSLLAVAEPGSFSGSLQNSGLLPSLEGTYADQSFVDTLTKYEYNPDEAAKLLESIGWTKQGNMWVDEKGESPVISIATISSWPSFMMTGEAMSQMLADFGFNIDFKPMEFGLWNDFTRADEKMICCTFVAQAPTYAHPWECFNDLFVANTRTGWEKLEPGQDRIFTDPVDGKEYNVTEMLRKMFTTYDDAELKDLTQQLMKLSNDLCGFISVLEKGAPVRIYDPKLHLSEAEMNALQTSYYYFGDLNVMLAKMLHDNQIYFTK